jgi:hypothetical protein
MPDFMRAEKLIIDLGSQYTLQKLYLFAVLLISILYGDILASLPLEVFKDRANYLLYAQYSWPRLMSLADAGLLSLLANEPLWLLINAGMAIVFSPETTLSLIIGVPSFLVSYHVLRMNPHSFLWIVLFLLIPQIIKNHIVHLRQGVAIAVFLIGWFSVRSQVRWSLFALTPFIHSSFFFVIGLLLLTIVSLKIRMAADLRTLLFATAGVGVGIGLSWITLVLGARQALRYEFVATDFSGHGFLFWGAIFAMMCCQGKEFMRHHAFELGAIVFYMGTYFLIEVSARIFESVLILVLIAGLRLTGWRRPAFLTSVLFYGGYSYTMRISAPYLGWGGGG